MAEPREKALAVAQEFNGCHVPNPCPFCNALARALDTFAAEAVREWQETSESWRCSELAWQAWAAGLLAEFGDRPRGGTWGDDMARALIADRIRARGKGDGNDP